MFVTMVFVHDKLHKATNGINMNGLELTSSEASLVIWRQCHISNNNPSFISDWKKQPKCNNEFLYNFPHPLKFMTTNSKTYHYLHQLLLIENSSSLLRR